MPTVTPRTETYQIAPIPGRRHELRKWLWRVTSAVAIIAPLAFLIGALGVKMGLWDWPFGLMTMSGVIGKNLLIASLVLGVLSLAAGFALKPRSKRAITAGLIAIVVGAAGLGWAGGVRAKARSLPFIHDISTDTQDPPAFAGRILGEREGLNSLDYVGKRDRAEEDGGELVSVLQARSYKDIRPIVTSRSPGDALSRAEALAGQMGWEVKDVTRSDAGGRVEATDTTFWYGFKDDVVIRVRPGSGGGSVVDVRSVSRVGGSDIGKNADRVRDFTEAFGS